MHPLRLLALGALVTAVGCASSITLQMSPRSPAYVDESSLSPRLQAERFDRIMIVPPSGSAGVQFQENLAAIERSFIARGVTVISSAITSRVLIEDATRNQQRTDTAIQLSEVERALLLARESNADAVLQIGSLSFIDSDQSDFGRRYFIQEKETKTFREVVQSDYEAEMDRDLFRYWLGGRVFAFTGRLIDVENGQIVGSFKIDVPSINVADPLTMVFNKDGEVESRSYDWAADQRRAQARENRAVTELFDRLALLLAQGI